MTMRDATQWLVVALTTLVIGCADRAGDASPANGDAAGVTDEDSPRDIAEVVERMMPALERLSGLDRRETLRVRRQSREEARAYVERRLESEMPAPEREALRRTYVALGLLPPDLDLDRLLLDLYTEQVLGYYDPGERTLFVVADGSLREIEPVIAHELVHALQDQHTDLDALIARERGNDRQTAAHAAMEGHAMVVMFSLLAERASGRQVDPASLPNPATELGPALEADNDEYPVFRRAPRVIRETLLFPYISGSGFVHAVWRARRPQRRYPAPLDSLLPQSTEQVMQPEDHFVHRRDAPLDVTIDRVPEGWTILREDGFGQLETSIFLAQHLGDGARAAADGWGGDRYVLLESPDGVEALLWRSVWDTPAAAERFARAAEEAAAKRPSRRVTIMREQVRGRAAVRIVDAPADGDISALTGGT